jgi:hypothetical protein
MKTTLNKIRDNLPCTSGWEKLLRSLNKTKADDEPISIVQIIDSNGLDDALWCFRAVIGHDREIRQYMVWCARQVQHLMTDPRSLNALDVAERFANGLATQEELAAARAAGDAAWDAAGGAGDAGDAALAALAARNAALAAVRAAWAATVSTLAAAWTAIGSAEDVALAARDAAWTARDAAWTAALAAKGAAKAAGAAGDAAWTSARDAQEKKLRDLCACCDQNPVAAIAEQGEKE